MKIVLEIEVDLVSLEVLVLGFACSDSDRMLAGRGQMQEVSSGGFGPSNYKPFLCSGLRFHGFVILKGWLDVPSQGLLAAFHFFH